MTHCSGGYNNLRLIGGKFLRRGYTTGSCAAAAAKAAAKMLLSQTLCESVTITTPNGAVLALDALNAEFSAEYASCAVQKYSGDDPDITDGCLVYARVVKSGGGAIRVTGGKGIGRVTKPGLDQPAGAYAINSVPRKMIQAECETVRQAFAYSGGLSVEISVPGGGELAERTFNPRLGIEGGISILGTTGIVEPMSKAAVAETIRAELSLLYEAGHRDALFTVGNYGEAFARNVLRLSFEAHVMCSNFIGEALTAAAEKGFKRALLVGHIGKLVKLGICITDTHSSSGDGRVETLIACALEAGAETETLRQMLPCVTADAALACLERAGIREKTLNILGGRIDATLKRRVAGYVEAGFICFSGLGEQAAVCAQNETAKNLLKIFAR
ncbi:MAG: cobalt-precorrin-5B (C(1))-methyltransferase CbiD [Clostridiales bacterium]|jgi:cobalt-precorrin-5B (C1)-methyltransferase|nr:cobalt-precorrin-5B (C(1))-methyltransferase CbiD [Clostridiales bacterium]